MLGLHFIETKKISIRLGKFYSRLFEARHTGAYDDFVILEKEFVEELHTSAK